MAGNGSFGYAGDGGPATLAQINRPYDTALDATGNLYIVDSQNNLIRKVAVNTGIITTVAGDGVAAHSGDGGPASNAELWWPSHIAIDGSGNIYISEDGDNAIRRIDAGTGLISTSTSGALVNALVCDSAGNLYVASYAGIEEVAVGTGTVTTISGSVGPGGIALDSHENLYVTVGGVVEKVAAGGAMTVVAGVGGTGMCSNISGDGGPATSASLCFPAGIGFDGHDNLYIADGQNDVIRKVDAQTGIISTMAGIWQHPWSAVGDGYPATQVAVYYPQHIKVDAAGNVYFASTAVGRVQIITAPAAAPTKATPQPVLSVPSGTYNTPQVLTVSDTVPGAAFYPVFLDSQGGPDTVPTVLAGTEGFYGSLNLTGSLNLSMVAVAPGYMPSAPVVGNYTITAPPANVISTVVGGGSAGFSASGGAALSVELGDPMGIAMDVGGNLYITDIYYNVIWKQDAATGNVSVFAGNGTVGETGDNGAATAAQLNRPESVAVDPSGNVYIGEVSGQRVREVAAQTGVITTIAGPGNSSVLGDGGPAAQAYIDNPAGLATDAVGNLYIADQNRIRMISAKSGIITTVAGGGSNAPGDGGLATQGTLVEPEGVAVDATGNLYIAETGGARVRMVNAQTGILSTIGGNGSAGTSGNGELATEAEIDPLSVAVDKAGNVYVSTWPQDIRKISKSDGLITEFAGNGYLGINGDGQSATIASLCNPQGIVLDATGNLYEVDGCSARVRKVSPPTAAATPVISLANGSYVGSQSVTITDATAGATIYYTTDGTTPTTSSTAYSGAITVAQSENLRAIAFASGYVASAVASATYTINTPPPPGTYSLSATNVTLAAGGSGTSTLTVSSTNGYVGTVTLSCAVTSSPANAVHTPTCAVSQTVALSASATNGTAAVTVSSTAASASLAPRDSLWKKAGGGMALATLFVLLVPRRQRRAWTTMGLVLLATLVIGLGACGGGGSSGSASNQQTNPGTTTGAYTITVNATGSDAAHTTASTTFTLTVN